MKDISLSTESIFELDKNLIFLSGENGAKFMTSGPCDLSGLKKNALLFVKDKKFLQRLLEKIEEISELNIGLIIDENLFSKATTEQKSSLDSSGIWRASTKCMNNTLSIISKEFYDLKYIETMPLVDGRQMSSADIHPTASIAQNVTIGANVIIKKDVMIHSGAVIMANVEVGEGSVIYPNSTIYPFVKIGADCRIHSSVVIGADGFGYNFQDGKHQKVWHTGGVIISDEVEIGANSCVDGGTFSPTLIGEGTKLDNHVQIGHNCNLGTGVVICGHVAIGGSSNIGDFTVFGGKSGMGHGHTLGKGCQVAGGALVNSDWPDGSVLGGHPARNLKEWMKGVAYIRKESLAKKKKL